MRFAPLHGELNDAEMQRSIQVAAGWARDGKTQAHGCELEPGQTDIPGAMGECFYHKVMGIEWRPNNGGGYKMPDAGWKTQIRCAPCKARRPPVGFGTLIVRPPDPWRRFPGDDPRDDFALVAGNAPYFVVLGWIKGRDAMQPQWLKPEGGRPPAWFVHNRFLNKNLEYLL